MRVVQNEVLQRCVIPAKAGIQSPGTRGQVWMPAFAGMTLTFLSHPPILNDSRDSSCGIDCNLAVRVEAS
jgi:hypothetical protein